MLAAVFLPVAAVAAVVPAEVVAAAAGAGPDVPLLGLAVGSWAALPMARVTMLLSLLLPLPELLPPELPALLLLLFPRLSLSARARAAAMAALPLAVVAGSLGPWPLLPAERGALGPPC